MHTPLPVFQSAGSGQLTPTFVRVSSAARNGETPPLPRGHVGFGKLFSLGAQHIKVLDMASIQSWVVKRCPMACGVETPKVEIKDSGHPCVVSAADCAMFNVQSVDLLALFLCSVFWILWIESWGCFRAWCR